MNFKAKMALTSPQSSIGCHKDKLFGEFGLFSMSESERIEKIHFAESLVPILKIVVIAETLAKLLISN